MFKEKSEYQFFITGDKKNQARDFIVLFSPSIEIWKIISILEINSLNCSEIFSESGPDPISLFCQTCRYVIHQSLIYDKT